ncbi:MAG: DUF6660 family protein [Omnitrophica WOR_2 bacterium]
MKAICYLLSFYILVLTAIPCADGPQDYSMQITHINYHSNNTQHHDCADHCSPFCVCNCCVSPVTVQLNTVHIDYYPSVKEVYTAFSVQDFNTPVFPVWQPPKIS